MFGVNALSMPEAFAREHHPLRHPAEPSRPQPVGACHFLLVNPSAKSRICTCQIYHHNRSAPGDVCDCGHPACYHTHTFVDKISEVVTGARVDWEERIKRLEDLFQVEKDSRETSFARERASWEREVRILREALTPFYRTEQEMQRRLLELEDRLENTVNMQHRFGERLVSLDDGYLGLEKRMAVMSTTLGTDQHHLHYHQQHQPQQQQQQQQQQHLIHHPHPHQQISPNNSDDLPGLTSGDERSSSSSFSRHQTPSEINATSTTSVPNIEPESPRSSGVLNLASLPRPAIAPYVVPKRATPPREEREEPRSSGFLGVDVKEQIKMNLMRRQAAGQRGRASPSTHSNAGSHRMHPYQNGHHQYQSPGPSDRSSTPQISSIRHSTPRSLPRPSPPVNGYVNADHIMYSDMRNPRERTQMVAAGPDLMALDVLANVSAATPVMH